MSRRKMQPLKHIKSSLSATDPNPQLLGWSIPNNTTRENNNITTIVSDLTNRQKMRFQVRNKHDIRDKELKQNQVNTQS